MNTASIQHLLSQPNHAIVAVSRPVGGPQVTPVWYIWDGTAAYFSTQTDRAKYLNIQRDPAISLLIDDSQGFGYVALYGQATFIRPDDADFVGLTTAIIDKYTGPEMRDAMLQSALADKRVVIRLQPTRIITPGMEA